MYLFAHIVFLVLAGITLSLQNPYFKVPLQIRSPVLAAHNKNSSFQYRNPKTERFFVDGKGIPEVDFDVGESYAGLLPNTPTGNSSLFFWFFPSNNPNATDEITVWLNGGPGCSSLDGMLRGSGPFVWRAGTQKPRPNPYSWNKLTNIVYIDQPAGTGFSSGSSTVNDEKDVAEQFMSFFKHFVDTFGLHRRKVYLTGENYAGMYVPYIASAMLDMNDRRYFNVKGIKLDSPFISELPVMRYAPAMRHVLHYKNVFALENSFVLEMEKLADRCGFNKFLDEALTFPPPKDFPSVPDPGENNCHIWDILVMEAYQINPCFNMYHLTDFCPYLWDVMGLPSLEGPPNDNYFNRSDVQKVIHVPPTNYEVCSGSPFVDFDMSAPSGWGSLPSVIERTNNTIISHGMLDFMLLMNGTLIAIQNMTWNGVQGFQKLPYDEAFFVPHHNALKNVAFGMVKLPFIWDAGAGFSGTTITERGLTFTTLNLAGHQASQYTPGAAFRQLEFLLGRIKSLQDSTAYTIPMETEDEYTIPTESENGVYTS